MFPLGFGVAFNSSSTGPALNRRAPEVQKPLWKILLNGWKSLRITGACSYFSHSLPLNLCFHLTYLKPFALMFSNTLKLAGLENSRIEYSIKKKWFALKKISYFWKCDESNGCDNVEVLVPLGGKVQLKRERNKVHGILWAGIENK